MNAFMATLVEVAEQIAWIGSAMRTSDNGSVQYSDPIFDFNRLRFRTAPLMDCESQSCWIGLFTNAVIARGFEVPPREHHEVGVESPLEVLTAVCGARYITEFRKGLVIKGLSAMLIPTQNYKDVIQWHLILGDPEKRLSYQEADTQCPNRCSLAEFDVEAIRTKRAIVGWWSESRSEAPSSSVDRSEAKEIARSIRLSGGSLRFDRLSLGTYNLA